MDRLAEIKDKFDVEFLHIPDEDIRWLLDEIKTLRQAAHADQIVIQRLRKEVDHWVGVVKVMNEARAGDEYVIENQRLAALTGCLATEAEALKRERDDLKTEFEQLRERYQNAIALIETDTQTIKTLQAKLARANQRAASRAGKVPR